MRPLLTTPWKGQLKHTDSFVIVVVAFMGAYGLIAIGIVPLMIGSWVNSLGIDEKTAGFISSAGFIGMTLGLVISVLLLKRHTVIQIVAVGIGISVIADGLSILAHEPVSLGVMRFSAGIGYGLLEASIVSWFARNEQADRCFAVFMLLQLAVITLLFVLIPLFEATLAGATPYVFLIGFGLVTLLGLPLLNLNASAVSAATDVPEGTERTYFCGNFIATAIVLSPTLYLAGVIGFWAYLQRFGVFLGVPKSQLGLTITVISLCGFPAAAAVLWLRNRLGRLIPVLLGILATLAPLIIFKAGNTSFTAFVVGSAVINMGWCFSYPYMQAIQADLDSTGRLAAIATIPQSIGIAIGPAAFAIALTSGSYSRALMFVITLLFLSLAGVILPALTADRVTLPNRLDDSVNNRVA